MTRDGPEENVRVELKAVAGVRGGEQESPGQHANDLVLPVRRDVDERPPGGDAVRAEEPFVLDVGLRFAGTAVLLDRDRDEPAGVGARDEDSFPEERQPVRTEALAGQ